MEQQQRQHLTVNEFSRKYDWFERFYSKKITQEFLDWWLGFHGHPDDYTDSLGEIDTYFSFCAMAWNGWEAHASTYHQSSSSTENPVPASEALKP